MSNLPGEVVTVTASDCKFVCMQQPPSPKWRFAPTGDFFVSIYIPKAPNAFHRFMQWLFFGFKYDRNV